MKITTAIIFSLLIFSSTSAIACGKCKSHSERSKERKSKKEKKHQKRSSEKKRDRYGASCLDAETLILQKTAQTKASP